MSITSVQPEPDIESAPVKRDECAASPAGDQRGAVPRDLLKRMVRGGLKRRRARLAAEALAAEQQWIGVERPAERLSNLETCIRSMGDATAEPIIARGAGAVEGLIGEADQLRVKELVLRHDLEETWRAPVIGPSGETVVSAQKRQAALSDQLTKETAAGSRKHVRTPARKLRAAKWLLVLDSPILFYFFSDFFNVALTRLSDRALIGQNGVGLAFALAFTAMATVGAATVLAGFGHELRKYKDDDGNLVLPKGGRAVLPVIYLTLAVAVVIGVGALMLTRIIGKAEGTSLAGANAWLLGSVLAVVVAGINVQVFALHLGDGSDLTEQIDGLAGQLAPVYARQQALRRAIVQIEPQLNALQRNGERITALALSKATEPVKGCDQVILMARSLHQACGWEAASAGDATPPRGLLRPAPYVDTASLDIALRHLRSDLASPDIPSGAEGVGQKPDAHPIRSGNIPRRYAEVEATGNAVDAEEVSDHSVLAASDLPGRLEQR